MTGPGDFSIDDLPCGCLVTTPSRIIVRANRYFTDELGWDLDDLIGQNVEILFSRGSRIFCDSYFYPMLLKDGECQEIQLTCRTASGSTTPIIANARMLDDGRVTWSIFSATNRNQLLDELAAARRMSEEKVLEAEAANAAKTLFLTTMSHELRTPLNGVIGMASAIEHTPLSDPQREMISTISNAGTHLLHLVEDVLDVAKIENGSIEMARSPFDGRDLIDGICAMTRPTADAKGLGLRIDASPLADAEILGDLKRIRQVVMNIISNAIKFTDQGMVSVHAGLERHADAARPLLTVCVTDTGTGVPDDQKRRIFERFYQGSHTDRLKHGGIGLGLAISKAICVQHGGDLTVADAVGGGSVFTATFAVDVAPARAKPSEGASYGASQERPVKLLFADDNPMNQKVAEALFSAFPVTMVFVDNGQDALDLLESGNFDAALLDINMPDMSGMECARILRRAEATTRRNRLPMIAFTANVMADQITGHIESGFDRHLAKPLDLQSVADCVNWVAAERNAVMA